MMLTACCSLVHDDEEIRQRAVCFASTYLNKLLRHRDSRARQKHGYSQRATQSGAWVRWCVCRVRAHELTPCVVRLTIEPLACRPSPRSRKAQGCQPTHKGCEYGLPRHRLLPLSFTLCSTESSCCVSVSYCLLLLSAVGVSSLVLQRRSQTWKPRHRDC